MKLIFVGTGSAFTVGCDNYHSNMVLQAPDKECLLIDCGSDARLSLHECGLSHQNINSVYISHLHADHVGGLEWLAFTSKFDSQSRKPKLFISDRLVNDLWNKVLSGGLSSIEGLATNLSTYFDVREIGEDSTFVWRNIDFHLIQTVHIMSGYTLMPSFGLLFTINNITVFITTDTQLSLHQMMVFYQLADVIFHDCETASGKSGVHAHYDELKTLDPKIKSKMWLYHYNPGPLPDATKDGFRGFVKRGQCFDFDDPSSFNMS